MASRIGLGAFVLSLATAASAMLVPVSASAVSIDGFKGQGLEKIYGSYGPGGNCTRQPLLVVDDRGMTFTVAGQTTTRAKVEYAVSYMGPEYEGTTMVFFPFPVNDDDFGTLLMYMNYEERPGEVRFESNVGPGQRLNAMQTALVAAPLRRCAGTAPTVAAAPLATAPQPAAAPAVPVEWTNLASLAGKAGAGDVLGTGAVGAAIRAQMGGKFDALVNNLNVSGALQRQGSAYFLSGNAPRRGGEEQAYVVLDPARRLVQVGLWERGKLTVYAPRTGRLPLPTEIATLVNNSPPEDATPLPGTPWELRPAAGREPIAYVDAAGSTHYSAFSVFCDGNLPVLAALTTQPLAGQTHTVTWNFAGRLVDVVVRRGNTEGTFWQASLAGSPLIAMLAQNSGAVLLRLDGQLEGQASLTGSTATLRSALRTCARL